MPTPHIAWRGRYEPGVPQGLPPADRSFPQLLVEAAGAAPGQTALVYYRRRTSYAQLEARVAVAAQAFLRLGLGPSERVAVALPNGPLACELLLGAMRAGGTVLAIAPELPAPRVAALLAASPPRLAVTWPGARPELQAALAASAALVLADPALDLPPLLNWLARLSGRSRRAAPGGGPAGGRAQRWERLLRGIKAGDEPSPSPADPALEVALAEGGSVRFSHGQLVGGAMMLRAWLADSVPGEDSWLPLLPLSSAFGLVTVLGAAPLARARVVLLPRWDGAVITDLSRWLPIAYAFADGDAMRALGADPQLPEADLGSVRGWIVGDPLTAEERWAFEAATGLDVCQGLAPEQAAGLVVCNPVNGHRQPDALGLLLPGVSARIRPGGSGGLELSGPNLAAGGWQSLGPGLFADRDGYVHQAPSEARGEPSPAEPGAA